MKLEDIAETIVATAKDEGMKVTVAPCGPAIHKENNLSMGIIVTPDYSISFYFANKSGRLMIREEKDLDKALAIGLDFIYV